MGKDVKRRFTVTLDIDTKDAEKQIKATVGNLKTILADLGNASDKMGYFEELVDYISQVDSALTAFKSKNADAFSHMFDGLDENLRKQLQSLFGTSQSQLSQIDVLREKLATLTPKSGINELRNFAAEINQLFADMGEVEPFNIEKEFFGRANEEHIQKLTNAVNNFAIVWKDVNSKIRQGFGFGASSDDSGFSGPIDKIQREVNILTQQVKKLEDVKGRFDKIVETVRSTKAGGVIPDSFNVDLTTESIKNLINEFDELSAKLGTGDKNTVDYYNNLIRMTEVVLSLQKALSSIKSDESLTNLFIKTSGKKGNLLSDLSNYAINVGNGSLTKVLNTSKNNDLGGIIESNKSFIRQLKSDGQDLQSVYQDLKNKIQEYYDICKKLDDENLDPDSKEFDNLSDRAQELEDFITSLGQSSNQISKIEQQLNSLRSTEGINTDVESTTQSIFKALGIQEMDFSIIDKAENKLQEFFSTAKKMRELTNLGDINLDSTIAELESARNELKQLAEQGYITEQEMQAVATALYGAKVNLRRLSDSTDGDSKNSGGTGTGSGGTVDVDFTKLEGAITTEAGKIVQKLGETLNVNVAQDSTDIAGKISDLKGDIEKIVSVIEAYKLSQETDARQSEINAMKQNLTQLRTTVSNLNNKYDSNGNLQRQELSAQFMSNGTISTLYGEKGTVPWDRVIAQLVNNLSSALVMDVHSHPLHSIGTSSDRYATDFFSGGKGDLSAFRKSKELGAQLTGMITGNILRTFDVSKFSKTVYQEFLKNLDQVEREYAKDPMYGKYIGKNSDGSRYYYPQSDIEGMHEVSKVFEEIMYVALGRTGFSRDQIDQEIFQKYDLTDDTQLTQVATKLVELNQAAQSSINPVQRLAEILQAFNVNLTSSTTATALSGFKKGELSAADVVNRLTMGRYHISNDLVNASQVIDSANQLSPVETILNSILEVLSTISAAVGNIQTSVKPNTSTEISSVMDELLSIAHGAGAQSVASGTTSIYDSNNISEYQKEEVIQTAQKSVSDFFVNLRSVTDHLKYGSDSDISEANDLVALFKNAVANVEDAMKQVVQYDTSKGTQSYTTVNGAQETATGYIADLRDKLLDFDTAIQPLLQILKNVRDNVQVSESKYQIGASETNQTNKTNQSLTQFTDNTDLISSLRSLTGQLEAIVGKVNSLNLEQYTLDKQSENNKNNNNSQNTVSKDYALDTTLQTTNGILTSIRDSLTGNNALSSLVDSLNSIVSELNNVINGIVSYQKAQKGNTAVSTNRLSNNEEVINISRTALEQVKDLGTDAQISKMKALSDGVVRVEGAFKNVDGVWEGFALKVNKANKAVDLAIEKQSAFAKLMNKIEQSTDVDDNPVKYSPEESYKEALELIQQLTAEGKNATVQFKDSGRYTISTLEQIGGLSKEVFQTFDKGQQQMSRTTVTMSNDVLSKITDTQKFVDDNSGIIGNQNKLQEYIDAYNKLINMNKQYASMDNLSQDDISEWNTQIDLVQRLGKEISALIVKQQKLRDTSAVNQIKTQLTGQKTSLTKLFKSLDFNENDLNLDDTQKNILTRFRDLTQNIDQYKINAANLSQAEIDNLNREVNAVTQLITEYKNLKNIKNGKGGASGSTYGTTQIFNASAKYNSLTAQAKNLGLTDNSAIIQNYAAAYERLVAAQQAFKVGEDLESDVGKAKIARFKEAQIECNNFAKELNSVVTASKKLEDIGTNKWDLQSDFINTDFGRQAALEQYVESIYGADATIGKFKDHFNQLTFTVNNGDGTFTEMTATINKAGTAIYSIVGDTQKATGAFSSFFNELKGKMKTIATYLISSFSLQRIWQQLRQGVTYVREIDSALTELKKVTDETDRTYQNFLQDMSKTAGIVGSTVSELTTMSAEWARLNI